MVSLKVMTSYKATKCLLLISLGVSKGFCNYFILLLMVCSFAFSVHPHSCGAYPLCLRLLNRLHRFIPTPVGHTPGTRLLHTHSSVHPHSCGAYSSFFSVLSSSLRFIPTPVGHTPTSKLSLRICYGSSPLLWGIQNHPVFCLVCVRFIPTPVGHT